MVTLPESEKKNMITMHKLKIKIELAISQYLSDQIGSVETRHQDDRHPGSKLAGYYLGDYSRVETEGDEVGYADAQHVGVDQLGNLHPRHEPSCS